MNTDTKQVIPIADRAIRLKNDGELLISSGASRFEVSWKNRKTRWSALLSRLSKSQQTGETHAEYMRLPKEQQDRIKDIGGFVGGFLKGGRRKNGCVESRQLLTLDADYAAPEFWQKAKEVALDGIDSCAMAVYSTHKHSDAKPRLRLIIPLEEPVSAEAYEALARKVAELIGIDYFDDSTYQATRLMYWPSHSSDVAPVFDYLDAPFLRADDVLQQYRDWTDVAEWPMSSREIEIRRKLADRQGDPTEKKGIVGAFCRTYTVTEAIEAFLPGVYVPTAKEDRWTYAAGSTAAGLVIYDDGRFAFSNHGTDPASGQLCNAFDLVRIHKFGHLDEGSEDKTGKARPSYKAMADFALEDPKVRTTVVNEKTQEAAGDFSEPEVKADDWKKQIRISDRGVVADAWNAELILENDERLKGIRWNEMNRRIEAKDVPWKRPAGPWRDADDAQLYQWLVRTYDVQFPREKFGMALTAVADRRRFHPVKEYLDGLPAWDGTERIRTLLIDLLGAEDNVYVREATQKCLTAAVARIYEPGVKFDSVLILQGPQSIGKSFLFDRLGGEWYSDNLSISDMKDKTAAEKLQGYWILELSELTGMRKTEVETVKGFISRKDDKYRAAYGRNTESRPRQCVLVGSTNDDTGFLRDVTGNRRFWPVKVTGVTERHPWNLTPDEIDQIWAEAKLCYELGEGLLLSPEAMKLAEAAQLEAMEHDDRQGIVEEFLQRRLPAGWDGMDYDRRMLFLDSEEVGTEERREVSNIEIWTEALHNPAKAMEPKDARAITAMMARIPGWQKTGDRKYLTGYGRQRIYRKG